MKKYPSQIGVGGLVVSKEEKKLVNHVLNSNRLTYGPMTKRFESEFSASHGCEYGLFMNSGTSALHVALAALKLKHGWADGDEVLIPSVTFVATCNIVIHNNLTPIFIDVEKDTYNIDPNELSKKITKRTRAIIPVHLLGLPASMEPIMELAKLHHLAVIEDSCESMFATYKGRPVGSIGDIGCFSTYVAHYLVTGVGGLAITNQSELADSMRSLMNHGRDTLYVSCTDDDGKVGNDLEAIVSRRFSFVEIGHSFRCTELEAALGVGQLSRSGEMITRRQAIAKKYLDALSKYSDYIQLPTCPADRTHSYMLFGIVVKKGSKKKLVNYLESLNIETRDMLPLINQPIYTRLFGELESKYPVSAWINNSGFYIGCHLYLTDEEVDFVIEAFEAYFSG